jgi:hypothetical protein
MSAKRNSLAATARPAQIRSTPPMNEIEYLLERARSCRKMARTSIIARDVNRLEERAVEFERQAAALEARLQSRL